MAGKKKAPVSVEQALMTLEEKIEILYAVSGNLRNSCRALNTSEDTYKKSYAKAGISPPSLDECKDRLAGRCLLNLVAMADSCNGKESFNANIGLIKHTRPLYIGHDPNAIIENR